MAKETFELNQISRYMVHRPSSDSKRQIFYVPLNSSVATTQYEKELFNDKEWNKNKDKFLNSPTNIRRIWITCKGITLETYAGVILNGKQTNLVMYKGFKNSDFKGEHSTDLMSLAKAYLKQQMHRETVDNKDSIVIKGNIISHTNSTWTFNNIEEIYFDWTALLCKESVTYLSQYMNKPDKQIFQTLLAMVNDTEQLQKGIGAQIKGYVTSKVLLQIVFNSEEVPKTFKRLNKIAMISNLSLLINEDKVPYLEVFNKDLSTKVAESKSHTYKSWLEKLKENESNNQALNTLLNNNYILTWSRNIPLNRESFTIKDSNYIFDKRFLRSKVDNFYSLIHETELNELKNKLEKTNDTKELEEEMQKILDLSQKKETNACIGPIIEVAKQISYINAGIETGTKSNTGPWVNVVNDKANIDARLLQRFNSYLSEKGR